jgi:hypothetical protein
MQNKFKAQQPKAAEIDPATLRAAIEYKLANRRVEELQNERAGLFEKTHQIDRALDVAILRQRSALDALTAAAIGKRED